MNLDSLLASGAVQSWNLPLVLLLIKATTILLAALGITDPLLPVVDANEAMIEATGVDQLSFTAPGSDHTLVRSATFYEMELDGVRLVDWVASIVNGETVEDVHCDECGAPS